MHLLVSTRRRTLLLASGLLAMMAMTGCYERTVSAKGIGAINKNVQKPYRSETVLDKAVDKTFGQPKLPPPRTR